MQDCKLISTPFPTDLKLSSKMSPSSKEERMEMSRIPYALAVGSLMSVVICTRPDITHAVGVVSRGYVDSDYAGDLDESKSTIGYVFTLSGGTQRSSMVEDVAGSIVFLVPGKELSNGLIQIKNDLDLANCIAIGYKNGKMEDITCYAVSDFVGEDDVVIPNRSINDPFLNKLCNGSYINDFSDKPDVGESSQPCGKELEIESDDKNVGKQFKLVDGVIYPAFDPKLPWNEMKPTLGLRFEHPEHLKDCLTNHDVANGYQLWYGRNDYRSFFVLYGKDLAKGRSGGKKGKKGDWQYKKEKDEDELPKKDKGKLLRAPKKGTKKVVSGCTFRLWASWMQDGSCFQIKTLVPEHTCSRNFELGSLFTFKWIAKQFEFKIIQDPTITYRYIQEQIKKKYLINVSVGQCKRSKQRALFDHKGGLIEHYSRLWDYRKQLLDMNPGSSVHLHVDEKDDGKIYFKRIYICFKAMIEGWSAGCRKVIGLDGCFLKSTCRGELLTAMGRDGNNQIFPIA
nr:calcium/proton exchanger [Tanacetum cinerariifolium]